MFYVNQEIGGNLVKKSYLEPEMEIVKFSFLDSILTITPSRPTDVEEESVNQRGDDND